MKRRWLWPVLALLLALLLWWASPPARELSLDIVNRDPRLLDELSLYGAGVREALHLRDIEAGAEVQLVLALASAGELRLRARRGENRVDSRLLENVADLDADSATLELGPGQRYILFPETTE